VRGQTTGDAPHLDLDEEKAVQGAMLDLIRSGLVKSAHDVSDGGLAVCLAECTLDGLGAEIDLDVPDAMRLDAVLFGEAQSRIVFTATFDDGEMVQDTIVGTGARALPIGRVTGDRLRISLNGDVVLDEAVEALAEPYRTTIPRAMGA
jgi:phosphoribosylformylglycinamidine synthase